MNNPNNNSDAPEISYIRRHLFLGWWGLFVFGCVGIALETFHGFKLGMYLNVENETRRLMWTLGHAHGTLLSLVQIGFAATLSIVRPVDSVRTRRASRHLAIAQFLIPSGFILGGIVVHGGDPNLAVLLVPVGAVCFLIGIVITATLLKHASIARTSE